MTLTELRYVVSLAEQRHFGHAAEQCRVSQPTLSIAVKKLEHKLGVVLFERAGTGVQVTPLGERVVQKARSLLQQSVELEDMVNSGRDAMRDPLATGFLPTIGPYLLPRFIPLLQKQAGAMPLSVQEGDTATLARRLRLGELDAIVTTLPFAETDVATQKLFDEPFVVLLPAGHALCAKAAIAPDDLRADEVLLLTEGQCFREQVLAALPHLRKPADSIGAVNGYAGATLETLRHMVASGLGITVLPLSAAETGVYSVDWLAVRPFIGVAPCRTLALSWRVSFSRHRAIDVLRRAIEVSSAAYWRYTSVPLQAANGVLLTNGEW